MKVTLINHSDVLGGASVVTFRLMEALRAEGIDARMLVVSKSSGSPFVTEAAPRWRSRLPFLAEHLGIFCRNGFSRRTLFKVSTADAGLPLSRHPLVENADAVVLNWVNQGMLSLGEAGKIAAMKPTLWTMHDMWNMTALCHHAASCGKYRHHCETCPLLGSGAGRHDLSFRSFIRKEKLYSANNITFVSVSSWLTQKAGESALLAGQDIMTVPVAFPIEKDLSAPNLSRAELGLPEDKKLIIMCAARLDDPIKGLPVAIEALNLLNAAHRDDCAAVLVGAIRDADALCRLKLPHVATGPVSDKAAMKSIMGHAAAVISSSSYESFGATLLEGQAAGATPAAFTHDGRADIITDGETGYSAGNDSANAKALADAIEKALTSPIPREKLHGAAERFSGQSVARQYIDLISRKIKAT